jgi:hypothetical protein
MLASADPPAAAGEGLGSADGEQSGTRAVITDLRHTGSTVTLKFVIYNDSSAGIGMGGKLMPMAIAAIATWPVYI